MTADFKISWALRFWDLSQEAKSEFARVGVEAEQSKNEEAGIEFVSVVPSEVTTVERLLAIQRDMGEGRVDFIISIYVAEKEIVAIPPVLVDIISAIRPTIGDEGLVLNITLKPDYNIS